MALDVTVGGAASDSYVTIAEMASYLTEKYIPATTVALWNALASDAVKESVLRRACQILDRHVDWTGDIASSTQALSWPRAFVYDRNDRQIESSVIPTFLKEFQLETALWLLVQSGVTPETGNAEFDSIRVGSLEIDFNENGGARKLMLPETVIAALAPMGRYSADTAGSVKMVALARS